MERGYSAMAVVVGSSESVITAQNTLNTLKSLDAIAKRVEQPVSMFYEHNDQENKRADVDVQVRLAISTLTVLANRQNLEIDTKDIYNWANFSKTTSVEPQLAQLEIFTNSEDVNQVNDPISIASIYADDKVDTITAIPEYHAAGYLSEPSDQFEQLHYAISIDGIPDIVNNVAKTLDQYHAQRDSRAKQSSVLADNDDTTDDGLVL